MNLAKDFNPGYKAGFVKKKDGRQLLRPASRCWPTTGGDWPPRTLTGCRCTARRWKPALPARH